MHSLSALFALSLLSSIASADFWIYLGKSDTLQDGGGGTIPSDGEAWFLNAVPDCDDYGNSITITRGIDNDASSGGWACDGCSSPGAPDDDITRFEFYNGGDRPITADPGTSITLYKQDDGTYGMESTSDGTVGNCVRDSSDSIGPCPNTFMSASNAISALFCTTPLTIINGISGN